MVETATTIEYSEQEIRDELERQAQQRLGMPAVEMLERYAAGTLPDAGSVADLLVLADLLEDSNG
jgi:hypothetical protein